jgi:hypothetical protein
MRSCSTTPDGLETVLGDTGSLIRHASVTYRRTDDAQEVDCSWRDADAGELLAAAPWQTSAGSKDRTTIRVPIGVQPPRDM